MITIWIGDVQRNASDATEDWITQQIVRRRRNGENVCVRVGIDSTRANLSLTTPGCPCGMGVGRQANDTERRIMDLWRSLKLDTLTFSPGNVIAFLKRADGYL